MIGWRSWKTMTLIALGGSLMQIVAQSQLGNMTACGIQAFACGVWATLLLWPVSPSR